MAASFDPRVTCRDEERLERMLGLRGMERLRRAFGDSPEVARASWVDWQAADLEEGFRLLQVPSAAAEAAISLAEALGESAEGRGWVHRALQIWARHSEPWPILRERTRCWPSLAEADAPHANLFYLLILQEGLGRALAFFSDRGIPQTVIEETLGDVGLKLREHHRAYGGWGLRGPEIAFLLHSFHGDLYRLGRLQFHFAASSAPLRAYRHAVSGRVLALAEKDIRFRSDGRMADPGAVERAGEWTSCLWDGPEEVAGYPIAPWGAAESEPVRLSKIEWGAALLSPGDPVVHVHIPSEAPLDPGACAESFRRALHFLPRYFPDRPFSAFCCHSWLLDPQLDEILPAESNLVRFQREFYLYPLWDDPDAVLKFVFGRVPLSLAAAPRDTALRRNLLEKLERGEVWPGGGGFCLPSDLPWGNQVYRAQAGVWPPEEC